VACCVLLLLLLLLLIEMYLPRRRGDMTPSSTGRSAAQ
jgi:hypothetical protein